MPIDFCWYFMDHVPNHEQITNLPILVARGFWFVSWPLNHVIWCMKFPTLSLHPTKFGSYKCCGNADNRYKLLHLWLDYVVKILHNLLGRVPIQKVTTSLSLMAIRVVEVQIQNFNLQRDHVVKRTYNFKDVVHLTKLDLHPDKFDSHRYCGSADVKFPICHMTTWPKDHVTWWV